MNFFPAERRESAVTFDPVWDEIAEQYSQDVGVYPGQEALVLEHVRAGGTVLDVGCGPGHHLLRFKQRGLRVSGVDRSWAMLDIARGNILSAGESIVLYEQDATRLGFADDSFDAVISLNNTLGIIPGEDNRIAALREMVRVSRRSTILELMHSDNLSEVPVTYFRDRGGNLATYNAVRFHEEYVTAILGPLRHSFVRVRKSVLSSYFFAVVITK